VLFGSVSSPAEPSDGAAPATGGDEAK